MKIIISILFAFLFIGMSINAINNGVFVKFLGFVLLYMLTILSFFYVIFEANNKYYYTKINSYPQFIEKSFSHKLTSIIIFLLLLILTSIYTYYNTNVILLLN